MSRAASRAECLHRLPWRRLLPAERESPRTLQTRSGQAVVGRDDDHQQRHARTHGKHDGRRERGLRRARCCDFRDSKLIACVSGERIFCHQLPGDLARSRPIDALMSISARRRCRGYEPMFAEPMSSPTVQGYAALLGTAGLSDTGLGLGGAPGLILIVLVVFTALAGFLIVRCSTPLSK